MSTPNLIKIGENENLKIDVIAVCGDIYTDGGRLVASGRVIRLNADDVARLGITDVQAIADRYNGRAIDEPEEANNGNAIDEPAESGSGE